MFGHEKFGAYRKAIEYIAEVFKIIGRVPKGNADGVDQQYCQRLAIQDGGADQRQSQEIEFKL